VLKGKKLTNIRAAGKDEAVKLTPPIRMTLERALAWIQDDELVEVTPKSIRLRKLYLDPNERKRFEKTGRIEEAFVDEPGIETLPICIEAEFLAATKWLRLAAAAAKPPGLRKSLGCNRPSDAEYA
jgi:hypothetical protein